MNIPTIYEWCIMNGVEVDLHHHTHSRHEYDEDGIAINKGDWLCNECHCWNGKDRKAHPTHRKKLEYLLDKQARLEYYGGWTEDREALRFYLHEYFQSSVEYNIQDKVLEDLVEEIIERLLSEWYRPNNGDLKHDTRVNGGKVDIDPKAVKDERTRRSLQKKGERKFNDWWIGRMIEGEPGRTAYYYSKKSREWAEPVNGKGWSKDTIKDFMRREKIDE